MKHKRGIDCFKSAPRPPSKPKPNTGTKGEKVIFIRGRGGAGLFAPASGGRRERVWHFFINQTEGRIVDVGYDIVNVYSSEELP